MNKVCHMTSGHNQRDVRIFEKECVSLANAGYEVHLVAPGESGFEKNVRIHGMGECPVKRLKRMTVYSRKVYKEACKIDAQIYHFHEPELLPYGYLLKRKGKKVIFDSHEFYALQIMEKEYIPLVLRKYISKIYRIIEEICVRKIDAVVVPCTIGGKNYFDNKAPKTVLISNAPRFYKLDNEKKEIKEDCLCYVGGLTYNRGIWHLVKAMEHINGLLFLAGKFGSAEFEKDVKNLNGYEKVRYLGYLNSTEKRKLYMKSRIGICTLLNVGQYDKVDVLATKVCEYMSMGLPVVLSRTPYTEEVLREYPFGIAVDPGSPEEIADAVNYLLQNPDISYQMGQQGQKAIKEKFNWEIEEKKLLQLYADLSS